MSSCKQWCMSSDSFDPVILPHDKFFVLRDDVVEGGTKRRILSSILPDLQEKEIVYAGHAYGYAAYALGLAAQSCNKGVRVFFPSPRAETDIFQKTIQLPTVTFSIEKVTKQHELVEGAKRYAAETGAYFMPIGCATDNFYNQLVAFAKSLPMIPRETWCLAGSGLLCRALCEAWPTTRINAVNLGMPHLAIDKSRVTLFEAPEKPEEPAQIPPPYPSALYYDAKIWRFAQIHGGEGAFIWNVA
jgi:hypothetical protein